eukprot:775902-Alexandrium_andersonii.AAC.1
MSDTKSQAILALQAAGSTFLDTQLQVAFAICAFASGLDRYALFEHSRFSQVNVACRVWLETGPHALDPGPRGAGACAGSPPGGSAAHAGRCAPVCLPRGAADHTSPVPRQYLASTSPVPR